MSRGIRYLQIYPRFIHERICCGVDANVSASLEMAPKGTGMPGLIGRGVVDVYRLREALRLIGVRGGEKKGGVGPH